MTAVILAAGKSKRMRTDTSKVLHKLQGKTVISYVYSSLKKAGVSKAVAVCSRENLPGVKKEAEKIGIRSAGVIQRKQRGTADAVKSALTGFKGRTGYLLVTSGDMPLVCSSTYKKLISKSMRSKADCTLLTGLMPDAFGYGRIIREKGRIVGIKEQKDLSGNEGLLKEINAGVYVFRTRSLVKFISKIRNKNRQKEFYLTDIISLFFENGLRVASVTASSFEEIQGINTRQDLTRLMATLWKWKNDELMKKGVTIEDPGSTFIDKKYITIEL